VREGLQVALDYMQKSIMDLQKFSECVTKDTSVDEVVHRVNNIIVFLESSVQREYSAFCEESPSPSCVGSTSGIQMIMKGMASLEMMMTGMG
jgi:hypothetical protein